MKTASAQLEDDLAESVTTLAAAIEVTRKDAIVHRFTNATRSVVLGGQTFKHNGGFDPSDLTSTHDDGISSAAVSTFFDSELTEVDVRAGKLDQARVKIYWFNWSDPTSGTMTMLNGIVMRASVTDESACQLEISGRMSTATRPLGELRTPNCRAIFGDARCKVDIEALKVAVTISAVAGQTLTVTGADGAVATFFNQGLVFFTSGAMSGEGIDIGSHIQILSGAIVIGTQIKMYQPPQRPILPGDTADLYPGCDKTLARCLFYENVINFRGEPYVPTEKYQGQNALF